MKFLNVLVGFVAVMILFSLSCMSAEKSKYRDLSPSVIYTINSPEDAAKMLAIVIKKQADDYAKESGILSSTPKNSASNGDPAFWFTAKNQFNKPYFCEWKASITGKLKGTKGVEDKTVNVSGIITLAPNGQKGDTQRIERVITDPFDWGNDIVSISVIKNYKSTEEPRTVTADVMKSAGTVKAWAENADPVEANVVITKVIADPDKKKTK